MALTPLNNLMNTSGKVLKKDKPYKIKSKKIDKDMRLLSDTMEQVHTVKKYRAYYKEYKANPSDKAFLKSTRLTLLYMKILFQSLKNLF